MLATPQLVESRGFALASVGSWQQDGGAAAGRSERLAQASFSARAVKILAKKGIKLASQKYRETSSLVLVATGESAFFWAKEARRTVKSSVQDP